MRRIANLLTALIAAALFTAPPASAQSLTKMTIATGVDPAFSQFYVAKEAGLFEKNGLDVTINTGPSGSAMVPFLINNQIHAAYGSDLAGVINHNVDNNIVADFASRALEDFDVRLVHFFAMAQVAGYALGGCWTHIGSAQSVVAYSFIQRDVDGAFTPVQWIREMTPVILEMFALITIVIGIESWLF